MITHRVITVKKEVEDEVICDCCGQSCKKKEYVVDNPDNPEYGNVEKVFEYMSIEAHWGYYSNKDTEKWTAQICENCVDNKLSVLIKFKKNSYL